jgi:tetratricopeptide (TPR) repeat protein
MDRLALPLSKIRAAACALALALGSAAAEPADAMIARGDACDARNANRDALEIYLEADRARPGDAEILRRISKQYAQMMSDTDSKARKRALGAAALDYGKRAKSAAPDNAQARLGLAICYGRIAFLQPARTQVEMSRLIKEEVDAALALDPGDDLAWHVLGRWNYELANFNPALKFLAQTIYGKFPGASNERAAECFEKALALNPQRVINHVELGRARLALGRRDEARAAFQAALKLPSREKDDDESKARARKALDSL